MSLDFSLRGLLGQGPGASAAVLAGEARPRHTQATKSYTTMQSPFHSAPQDGKRGSSESRAVLTACELPAARAGMAAIFCARPAAERKVTLSVTAAPTVRPDDAAIAPGTGEGAEPPVAVDAHVHVHPIFDHARFLDAALRNAALAGLDGGPIWLLLTEMAGVHAYRTLADRPPAGWQSLPFADGCTIELRRDDGGRVLVTAGRQIVIEGGLELLALGTDADIPDRIGMAEALERTLSLGAFPVVPWGFGKWTGRRGRVLAELLDGPEGEVVFLGDNGGRAVFLPRPALFERVEAAGRRVLPGSDPLPFASHVDRVGSYGLIVPMAVDPRAPFAALRAKLADPRPKLQSYGRRASPLAFIRDQLAMQIVKRRQG